LIIAILEKQNIDYIPGKQNILTQVTAILLPLLITTQTGHRIKWDHFDVSATGQSDVHFKMKKTLFIRDLKPVLNKNVGSEKLLLY